MTARRVVVTGDTGSVAVRVIERLSAAGGIDAIALDRRPPAPVGAAEFHQGDLRELDLDTVFEGGDMIVHLASAYGRSEFVDAARHDTRVARLVLDAAARVGVPHVLLLSSAMVYGARADNPIPLTEAAPLRPDELSFAESKVTIERLGRDWQAATGGKLTVLRPTTAVAQGESSWVARSLQHAAAFASDANPHLQFLHLDDLASAVEQIIIERVEGVFNVAPDGWVRADEVRVLSGRAPRLRMPDAVADELARFSWNSGLYATPPGIMPYATNAWVVANDRLRAIGWAPSYSNVEAYVEGYEARPWAMINARQRQQLALGGAGVVLVIVVWLIARLRSRAR